MKYFMIILMSILICAPVVMAVPTGFSPLSGSDLYIGDTFTNTGGLAYWIPSDSPTSFTGSYCGGTTYNNILSPSEQYYNCIVSKTYIVASDEYIHNIYAYYVVHA